MPRPVHASSLLLLLLLPALWLAAVVAVAAPDAAQRARYTTRFDHIDLERILSSRRLVANYVDCLLGRKRCPPEGAELKRVLPDALATRCARCSERQREAAVRAIRLLRQRYPDLWAPLQAKWDPTGEHTRRLEQATARRATTPRTSTGAPAAPTGSAAARTTSVKSASAAASHTVPAATSASNDAATAVDNKRGRLEQTTAHRVSMPNTSPVVPAASPTGSAAARTTSVKSASAAASHTAPAASASNTVAAVDNKRGQLEQTTATRASMPRISTATPTAASSPNPTVSVGGTAAAARSNSVNPADATHNTYITPSLPVRTNAGIPSAVTNITYLIPVIEAASNAASPASAARINSVGPAPATVSHTNPGSPVAASASNTDTTGYKRGRYELAAVRRAISPRTIPAASPTTGSPGGSVTAVRTNSVNLADATHNTCVTPTASPASAARANSVIPALESASHTIPDSPFAESSPNPVTAANKSRSRLMILVAPSAGLTALDGSIAATTWTPANSRAKISATARPFPVIPSATAVATSTISPQGSPITAGPAEAGSISAVKTNSVIPAAGSP